MLRLVTGPNKEPVEVMDVRAQLPAIVDQDAGLIESFIAAATGDCEQRLGRKLLTQTWEQVLDDFPAKGGVIEFKTGPVQVVNSITYIDTGGASDTLDPDNDVIFTPEAGPYPARLTPLSGKAWPATQARIASVVIEFDAGYGEPEDVPQEIKQWIIAHVGSLNEFREADIAGVQVNRIPTLDGLIRQHRFGTGFA